jgi:hypothetical protein
MASLTLIILFSEMLEISENIFFLKENKESDKIFGNISFVEMESAKNH